MLDQKGMHGATYEYVLSSLRSRWSLLQAHLYTVKGPNSPMGPSTVL